jgi:hypothetical protein
MDEEEFRPIFNLFISTSPYFLNSLALCFLTAADDDFWNPQGGLGIGNRNALAILSAGSDSKA